mmetsp:Transcript_42437/g.76218  ORF Transcript_42437/g.76218 Transcript_42437/m.76218 type:complete len:675 (+) Transcript_42437:53-2077(+)|eukprot:CAMPEP_0197628568 /NCGR_PEP_ID=MMETSP1338-20131121/6820_1 /TAXON_ID=43686 ORGANISM="Pelagodinium beii, Strain RCC1491" /NCGR_SAMPLE_ID=MMETSP1338 /ASSEMBLY_ACC=CAM_ASM_000754 /LENGTH=674 /DNA_ID=CAMNT_0043199551 /DNA_START=53 /DNA_END=2077 /DNA_ORIENTATION=+
MGNVACSTPCSSAPCGDGDPRPLVSGVQKTLLLSIPGVPPVQVSSTSSSPSSPSAPATARSSWEFNPIGHDIETLQQLASQLLAPSFVTCGGKQVDVLQRFVKAVSRGYRQIAFHNFSRAVDGLQALCWQGSLMPWESLLTAPLRFSLAMASLAVNIGHPGFDNAFLVDIGDEMAACYNDISPLENMHCSRLFEILKVQSHNVLAHLPHEDFRDLRRLVIDAILHTDPSCHGTVVEHIRDLCRRGIPESVTVESLQGLRQADGGSGPLSRRFIEQAVSRALLLSGDLSHQTRQWDTANLWADLLRSELGAQNQKEKELGLPASAGLLLPQRSDLQLHLGCSQVAPLLGAQLRLFPALQPAANQLTDNAVRWAQELSVAEKDKDAQSLRGKDDRATQIGNLLDVSRPLPLLTPASSDEPRSPDAFDDSPGGLVKGRRPSEQDSGKSMASTVATWTTAEPTAAPPPLVREVRRWRFTEDVPHMGESSNQKFKEYTESKKGRELVLLYVVTDESDGAVPGSKPLVYRFLDQEDATQAEVEAADAAVFAGQKAAAEGEDEVVPNKRITTTSQGSAASKNSSASSSSLPPGFRVPMTTQKAADSVVTNIHTDKFDQVLSNLLTTQAKDGVPSDDRRKRTSEMSVVSSASSLNRASTGRTNVLEVVSDMWNTRLSHHKDN